MCIPHLWSRHSPRDCKEGFHWQCPWGKKTVWHSLALKFHACPWGCLCTQWAGEALAICVSQGVSMTPEIRHPDFSSLPPLEVIRKYLMFSLVAPNPLTSVGVKHCSGHLWLCKCDGIFEDNSHKELQREQSCYTGLHHWKDCGKLKCRTFSLLCSVHVCSGFSLWSAVRWQSSPHLLHFTIALHLLNLCPGKKNNRKKIVLLWEHIHFWLPALIFRRKCLKLVTVFSKFSCCMKLL